MICEHTLRKVLIACSAMVFLTSLSAQESLESAQRAPKLLAAIEDQTLFLNPRLVDSGGTVASQRVYLRDLHLSFGDVPNQRFSAYPYNKSIADAWIVENFLIVLAKSTGTAQVAVTASNGFGSMIDWFIVHVEESSDEHAMNQADVAFESEFVTAQIDLTSENVLQLPELSAQPAKYRVVPDLPAGLIYDNGTKSIHGRIEGAIANSTYYWIGVTDHGVAIQQFSFELTSKNGRVMNTSQSLLSFDRSLTPSVGEISDTGDSQSASPSRRTPARTIAASRPQQPRSESEYSIHQTLLHGVTSAMHSRFRDLSIRQDSPQSNASTLWNYASTRVTSDSSRTGFEPSGIYVGFDTQLEENLTTGVTIGFDSQGFNNTSLRNSNRTRTFASTNLSSVMPYARWHDGSGAEVWGILGVARDFSQYEGAPAQNADLNGRNLFMGAVGWRHLIGSSGNVHLSTVGDAGLTIPLRTSIADSDAELLDYISSRSLRAGLEMSFTGEQVQPYVGLSGRVNSNPLTRDATLEALGGVRYTSLSGLTFEAEGRARSAQDAFQDSELVFSVAAHLDPGLPGEGLALSVAPTYGVNPSRLLTTPDPSIGFVNYKDQDLRNSGEYVWAMSGSLSYGMPIGGSGVITPFGQIAISTLDQTRMGVRVALNSNLDRLFNLEIASVLSRFDQQAFEKGVDIQLRLVF